MILEQLTVGGPGFSVAEVNRVFFAFPQAVQSAHAALQSFTVRASGDDIDLGDVRVSVETLFDKEQSQTSGIVEVRIRLTGSTGGVFISSESIEAEVRVVVVGL